MDRLRGWGRIGAFGAALIIGSAASAGAAPVLFTLQGAESDDVSASVLFSYVGLTESTGRVDVTVTNTSGAYDPRLTAIAFNLPESVSGIGGFTSSLSRWRATYAPDDINTPGRFGSFDAAALTGPNFAGGSPRKGLAPNASASFAFAVVGAGMLGLDESAFLGAAASGAGEGAPVFAARFQQVGLQGDRSDVASSTAAVSEPTTLLLSGIGLLVLGTVGRRLWLNA